jgi:FAD/FMN-containing dehydrogenase
MPILRAGYHTKAMNEEAIRAFESSLAGTLIRRTDANYDEARSLYNGMIDKRPLLIARCANADDVVAAVDFGRENNLLTAIRGGGHNGPGLGSCDDGLVIDLSQMKDVHVDPATGRVRVQPGCTSSEVDNATHEFGIAVPVGIVGSTGIAGLTLGGGTGYLTRKHGLTVDNLLEAEVVLADGSKVTANKDSHPDLFWALKGGGGNFGVVTSFLYQAHPAKMVYGGPIFWDAAIHGKKVMTAYREFMKTAPEELGIFVGLKTVPPMEPFPEEGWNKRACAIIGAYNGPIAEGERLMAGLLGQLPPPIFNWMGEMPLPAMNSMFDPFFPKGLQWYWKGDFVGSLSDEAIDTHIAEAAKAPTPNCLMHLYPIDGAVHRVAKDATPWGARDALFNMVIAGISPEASDAEALKSWGRSYWDKIHPHNLEGGYVNFMMGDESPSKLKASYGPNYDRLAAIKAKYDPDNFFRVNQNIAPAISS